MKMEKRGRGRPCIAEERRVRNLSIVIPQNLRTLARLQANAEGKSLTGFINDCVIEKIENTLTHKVQ